VLTLVSASQFQIFIWGLLRLLDKAVKKHHPALFVNVEQHSGHAVPDEIGPHLM
jgi:hypothetical protein